eukprot:30895-Pelagococcus_subviridis.AAC.12
MVSTYSTPIAIASSLGYKSYARTLHPIPMSGAATQRPICRGRFHGSVERGRDQLLTPRDGTHLPGADDAHRFPVHVEPDETAQGVVPL